MVVNPSNTKLACVVGRCHVNPDRNNVRIKLLNLSPNKVKISTGTTVA